MSLDFEALSKSVRDVVGLPKARHATSYQDPTYRAVKAVFQTIAQALQRGESVRVMGLGTFKIQKFKAHTIGIISYPYKTDYSDKTNRRTFTIPEQNKVVFKPCESLKRLLNKDL